MNDGTAGQGGPREERVPALGPGLRVKVATLAVPGAAFAVVLAGVLGESQPVWFDSEIAGYMAEHRRPWLTSVLRVVTWLGSTAVLVPVAVAVGLALRRITRCWRPLGILAASLAGASALSNLIKLAVGRDRPADGLVDSITYAFPSGHATAATAGWIAIAAMVGGSAAGRRRRVWIYATALLVIAIVGISRVYLGVHWSTDVLGGWALGGLWIGVVLVAVSQRGQTSEMPNIGPVELVVVLLILFTTGMLVRGLLS